jgi:hypothetical protein
MAEVALSDSVFGLWLGVLLRKNWCPFTASDADSCARRFWSEGVHKNVLAILPQAPEPQLRSTCKARQPINYTDLIERLDFDVIEGNIIFDEGIELLLTPAHPREAN